MSELANSCSPLYITSLKNQHRIFAAQNFWFVTLLIYISLIKTIGKPFNNSHIEHVISQSYSITPLWHSCAFLYRTGSKWIMTSSTLSIFTWQKYLIPKNVAGWLRAYIRVLCNQCYEQLEVTLQVVLWHETFVNTLKAVQIYFIDKFLW